MKGYTKILVYKDENGEWRWKATSHNGRKLANPGEGYKRKSACLHSLGVFLASVINKKYMIVTE